MSNRFQTPGSSRRFLPPSSARAQDAGLHQPSSARPALKFTQSSQTTGSTQVPRFRSITSEPIDDIETSCGDELTSSPLPERSKRGSKPNTRDAKDEVRSDEGDGAERPPSGHVEFEEHHTEAYYSNASPGLRNRLNLSDVEDDFDDPRTPIPRKWRKRPQSETSIDDDLDNSPSVRAGHQSLTSQSEPANIQANILRSDRSDIDDQASHSSDDGASLSPIPISPTRSRFRLPTASSSVLPPSHAHPPHRPSFKPPPSKHPPSVTDVSAPDLLPETFSPSRRRGKQDYVPGGAAETVRNWVLGIAGSEKIGPNGLQRTDTIRAVDVSRDRTGRCVTVTSAEGERWLLVGQQRQHRRNAAHRAGEERLGNISDVREGSVVAVKGVGTRWTVDLARPDDSRERAVEDAVPDPEREQEQEDEEGEGGVYNVAVLWEVLNTDPDMKLEGG